MNLNEYQKELKMLEDEFNNGDLTFNEFEKMKKDLKRDLVI